MTTKEFMVWFCVNKDGFICMFADEPKRNTETKKWDSKFPFVNSILYDQIIKIVENAKMTWENDPEIITFQLGTQ